MPDTLKVEFPDFDATTLPDSIPDGFLAAHWHNEPCPHWIREEEDGNNLDLFIDYPNPANREFPDGRRFVLKREDGSVIEYTDRWWRVLDALEHLQGRTLAAKWVSRFGLGFHPDTPGQDYVNPDGARSLTDAEAAEYEADIDALFGFGDAYQHGLDAMRVAGLIDEDAEGLLTVDSPVGTRVMVNDVIDLYPVGTFCPGLTGTVVAVDAAAPGIVAHILLDDRFASLNEWDNKLQVWRDGTDEGSGCTLSRFQVIGSIDDLAQDARLIDDDDWGTERQIEAENLFFDVFHGILGDTPDFDGWCLKATTDEMITEGLRLLHAKREG